ncbi:phosphodiesterase [soil metagenome]
MILVAQLSDLHIREGGALAYGRVDTARHLREAIAHLNGLRPRPGAVAVTGDLVELGTEAEYRTCLAMLGALEIPWCPLPGNHDGPDFWQAMPLPPGAEMAPGIGYVAGVGAARLVMLDTSLPGRPDGEVTEARAAWLAATLAAEPAPPTLLFMHHPPIETGIAHMDSIGCGGIARLAGALSAAETLLAIGCGHVHRTIAGQIAGCPVMICPSPAHAVSLALDPETPASFHLEPPGILLYRLTERSGAWSCAVHLSQIGRYEGPHGFFAEDGGRLA